MKKIFFYLFIFLLPWQTRLILTPGKPEFLTFSIYLSEILLWLALAFWLTNADLKKIKIPGALVILCFYVLVSIFWSSDRVAAFRLWLFVFDGITAYLFLQNFNTYFKEKDGQNQTPPLKVRGGWGELWNGRTGLIYVFLISLFIASLFGIWQFFNLGSPAWKWLGLAARGAWNLGDIVVESGGTRWLRAYGPFPHPNIFGGYLAVGILLILSFPRRRESRPFLIYVLGAILFFALFLTFSRSAWLALAISALFLPLACPAKLLVGQERSGVIKGEAMRGIFKFILFLLTLFISLSIIFWPFVRTRTESSGRLEQKSNTERVASWRDGLVVWKQNPFFGVGMRNETVGYLVSYSQPAHNIFIVVLSQLGLVGFMIYLFLWRGFWKNPAVRPLLILFFIIGMLDHYLWTLYSGSMLFWLGLGLTNPDE